MNNLTLTPGAIVVIVVSILVIFFSAMFGVFLGFKLAKLTEKFIMKRIKMEDKNDV